ncbi:putative DNA primase/helicase [Formivibrio citricus]|uniref:Putative DNA primase/helicase n=1 Tax=Formivibrio citricus TaxID=83765 RepID=A0A1I4VKV4_9NEIS|nr:toprim domain-containing protein [Formivibrio citricus]SFN01882.1 putative DNA primase/helicase [Formivibrio citricus]
MNNRLDLIGLKDAARNRWPGILQAAGVDPKHLRNKHGACPVCGGKDRFRFTDKDGRGCYVCNKCRPDGGDGFHLLAAFRSCSFIEAARFVSDYLGGAAVTATAPSPEELARRKEREDAEQKRAWLNNRAVNLSTWRQAHPVMPGSPVGLYLRNRGLSLAEYPQALRFHPCLPYWDRGEDGKPIKLGDFCGMVAAVQAPDGALVAVHKTYLTGAGRKIDAPSPKKMSKPSGPLAGAACRLFPAGEKLAICEGIETGLAVHLGSGLPVWAGLNAFGLSQMVLPPEARQVFIYADHDENGTGQNAAKTLADRLTQEGRSVRILLPGKPGWDWLDVWNARASNDPQNEKDAA